MRIAAAMVLVLAAGSTASAQLFVQAPHVPGTAGGNGFSAFQGALAPAVEIYDREVADDFEVPAAGWTITSIETQWVPFDNLTTVAVTAVEIRFFQRDSGGGVGAQVGSTITVANPTVTTTGPLYFSRDLRNVVATLPGSGVALPGGQYFVQVQLVSDTNWFWITSSTTGSPINLSPLHNRRGPDMDPTLDLTWPAAWTATGPANPVGGAFLTPSEVAFRINGTVGGGGGGCYANCDGSTGTPALTPADFVCFLNKFRAGDPYANCDASTGTPALTPADFVCFLNKFRAGC